MERFAKSSVDMQRLVLQQMKIHNVYVEDFFELLLESFPHYLVDENIFRYLLIHHPSVALFVFKHEFKNKHYRLFNVFVETTWHQGLSTQIEVFSDFIKETSGVGVGVGSPSTASMWKKLLQCSSLRGWCPIRWVIAKVFKVPLCDIIDETKVYLDSLSYIGHYPTISMIKQQYPYCDNRETYMFIFRNLTEIKSLSIIKQQLVEPDHHQIFDYIIGSYFPASVNLISYLLAQPADERYGMSRCIKKLFKLWKLRFSDESLLKQTDTIDKFIYEMTLLSRCSVKDVNKYLIKPMIFWLKCQCNHHILKYGRRFVEQYQKKFDGSTANFNVLKIIFEYI